MRIGKFLKTSSRQLHQAGILTARLDCLILLEDVLGMNRARILAHDDVELTRAQTTLLTEYIKRRLHHEPLAYIRGHAMFYGRDFAVSPQTLVPRPETEAMIDLLKKYIDVQQHPIIADIGTGSGCIGITTALEITGAQVDLYDISDDALAVASKNSTILAPASAITTIQGDLLANLARAYDIILANLPYVPEDFPVNEAARFEPQLALFAGGDGLGAYQTFWQQIHALHHKPALIAIEAFPSQHHFLATLARQAGYALEEKRDFIQLFSRI